MALIAAYFDGVSGTDATGWVVDMEQPHRLARVCFVSETGQSLTWAATFWRNDVCRAVGRAGAFGYAVPLMLLAQIGRTFRVLTENGDFIQNGEFSLPDHILPPNYPEEQKPGLVFLHIQKTAGTSVRAALEGAVSASRRLLVYPDAPGVSLAQLVSLPFAQRQALSLVMGHTFFGIDRFCGGPMRYATILREPLGRVRSHYWHHRRSGSKAFRIGGVDVPLHVVVNEGLSEEFDNLQVRAVAGLASSEAPLNAISEDDVAMALDNVRRHFITVGDISTVNEDMGRLFSAIGACATAVPHLNAAKDTSGEDEFSAKIDWDAVARRHAPDMELYRSAAGNVSTI